MGEREWLKRKEKKREKKGKYRQERVDGNWITFWGGGGDVIINNNLWDSLGEASFTKISPSEALSTSLIFRLGLQSRSSWRVWKDGRRPVVVSRAPTPRRTYKGTVLQELVVQQQFWTTFMNKELRYTNSGESTENNMNPWTEKTSPARKILCLYKGKFRFPLRTMILLPTWNWISYR